jgi:putative lipoic acid-binding regulatory protein
MTTPDTLIEYPSRFPLKVMGASHPDLLPDVVDVCRRFDPGFDPAGIEQRPSSAGTFLGLTVTVEATSREQLEGLYRALAAHPLVRLVL